MSIKRTASVEQETEEAEESGTESVESTILSGYGTPGTSSD